ncbi:MAG: hypothetical protein P8P88_06385 [Polaribacter sp.]|nr:hypothetical protein [Polaribacter sp.]
MKKGILLLLGVFMTVSNVEAKKSDHRPELFTLNYYSYANTVNFSERGIDFFVFINGDFDFDINYNRNIRINRDFRGRIKTIGNVSVRYDLKGNVTRIGDIYINYFRNRITSVGDLRVSYDRWGTPKFYGNIRNYYFDNGIRFNVRYGDVCNFNDPFFFFFDFRRNYTQFREDRNFIYYKARPNASIGSRSKILKRRKQIKAYEINTKNSRRNSNSSYRKNNYSSNLSYDKTQENSRKSGINRYSKLTNKKSDTKRSTTRKKSEIDKTTAKNKRKTRG